MTQSPLSPSESSENDDPRHAAALKEYLHILEQGLSEYREVWLSNNTDLLPALRGRLETLEVLHAMVPRLHSAAADGEAPTVDAAMPRPVGEDLGDFRLVRMIGRGGMGIVYEAEQVSLGRRVAVKVLPFAAALEPKRLARFRQEAQAAAQLHHRHIVPVFAVGCERGMHYYAMQLIEGRSLAVLTSELRSPSPESETGVPHALPETVRDPVWFETVARIGVQAADALHFAHERGIVHRDVKPANLLINTQGELYVTDFGLAATRESLELTGTGELPGTLRYASPEQALGRRTLVDYRTDIYSLGATLRELITLSPPFTQENRHDLLLAIANHQPVTPSRINPAVPADLETIILKAMSQDRNDRYESGEEFARELTRFLAHEPIRSRRPGVFDQAWRILRRRPRATISVIGTLLSGVVVMALMIMYIAAARNEALTQTERARQSEQSLRVYRYVNDIRQSRLVIQLLHASDAIQILQQYIPGDKEPDNRGFEWYFLWNQCHRHRSELSGHEGPVYFTSFSPDGKLLVSASQDRTVKVWNLASRKLVQTLRGHTSDVTCVRFIGDGNELASIGDDRTVRLWQLGNDSPVGMLSGHETEGVGVAYSSQLGVIASADDDGWIFLWDLATRRMLFPKTKGHLRRIQAIEFSPDGRRLATCDGGDGTRIWEVDRSSGLKLLHTFPPPDGALQGVAWSHNGGKIADAARSGTVRIWDATTYESLLKTQIERLDAMSLTFTPGDDALLVANSESSVDIISVPTGEVVDRLLGQSTRFFDVQVSPDGNTIVSANSDHAISIWDRMDSQCELSASVQELAFGPNNDSLFTIDSEQHLEQWDLQHRELRFRFPEPIQPHRGFAISAAGKLLVTTTESSGVEFWDVSTPVPTKLPPLVPAVGQVVCFSRDGTHLVCGDAGNGIQVWDVISRELVASTTELRPTDRLSYIRDQDCLLVGPRNGVSHLWRIADQTTTMHYAESVNGFLIGPAGRTFCTNPGETITELDVSFDKPVVRMLWGHSAVIFSMACSPDGKTLVSGDQSGTLRMWNLETRREMFSETMGGAVTACEFSSNNQTLAVAVGTESEPRRRLYLWRGSRTPPP